MAVAYGSAASAASASASFTVNKPTSTASGDFLLAVLFSDDGTNGISGGATWTQLASAAAGGLTYRIMYKTAGGSEPTTYTVTQSGGNGGGTHASVIRATGGTGTPVFAVTTGQSSDTITTPSVTPSGSADLLIRAAGGVQGITAVTWTAPGGTTERTDQQAGNGTAGTTATAQLASGAATGTASFTASNFLAPAMGITITISGAVNASPTPDTVTATTTVPAPAAGAGAGAHPATVTATTTVPAPAAGAGAGAHPDVVVATATVPSPSITTDNAELVALDTVTATVTVPGPALSTGSAASPGTTLAAATVYLPDVDASASLTLTPVLVTTVVDGAVAEVPVLPGDQLDGMPGQIEFNGFVLGRTTPYRWLQLEGWRGKDTPDSGNAARANRSGSAPGRPLGRERALTWQALLRVPREEVEQAVLALENATPLLDSADQWPIVVNDLGTPYLAYGRIDRVNIPLDRLVRLGHAKLVLQWILADPRRYNINATGVTVAINTTVTISNAGSASTHPLLRFPGPVTTPRLHNQTLGRVLEINATVASGQELVVNTDLETAKVGPSGSPTTDVPITQASVSIPDWTLARGAQQVRYTAASGGSQCEVLYRDAWS